MKKLKTFRLLLAFLFPLVLESCKKELKGPPLPETKTDNPTLKITMVPSNGVLEEIKFENGKSIKMYRIDTNYLIDGDILMTPHQINVLKQINSGFSGAQTFTTEFLRYWPTGQVRFVINANFSNADRTMIEQAIAHWEASTSIDFVARTNQTDYVEFVPGPRNESFIGKKGGRQSISLIANGGFNTGSAIHEIGHAIGFYHEQSRADRDNFIEINWNNIRPGVASNFFTYADLGLPGDQLGTFDFNSVMLYPSFITDPSFVFDPFVPVMQRWDRSFWGLSNVLSGGDIETSNFIYGPPFARLRYEFVSQYEDDTRTEVIQDVYIDFFADAQCTQLFTLPVSRNFNVKYVEQTSQYNGGSWYYGGATQIIPYTFSAGNSSFYMGQITNYEERDGTWNPIQTKMSYFEPQTVIMR